MSNILDLPGDWKADVTVPDNLENVRVATLRQREEFQPNHLFRADHAKEIVDALHREHIVALLCHMPSDEVAASIPDRTGREDGIQYLLWSRVVGGARDMTAPTLVGPIQVAIDICQDPKFLAQAEQVLKYLLDDGVRNAAANAIHTFKSASPSGIPPHQARQLTWDILDMCKERGGVRKKEEGKELDILRLAKSMEAKAMAARKIFAHPWNKPGQLLAFSNADVVHGAATNRGVLHVDSNNAPGVVMLYNAYKPDESLGHQPGESLYRAAVHGLSGDNKWQGQVPASSKDATRFGLSIMSSRQPPNT